jgi:hypothetical protein
MSYNENTECYGNRGTWRRVDYAIRGSTENKYGTLQAGQIYAAAWHGSSIFNSVAFIVGADSGYHLYHMHMSVGIEIDLDNATFKRASLARSEGFGAGMPRINAINDIEKGLATLYVLDP